MWIIRFFINILIFIIIIGVLGFAGYGIWSLVQDTDNNDTISTQLIIENTADNNMSELIKKS